MVEEQFAGFFVAGDVSELVAYHKVVVDEPVFKENGVRVPAVPL